MKKIIFLGSLVAFLGLFFALPRMMDARFDFKEVCQPPLRTFSDGSFTFNVSFPPGGGTTCDTIEECPTIMLPDGAVVYSISVDLELADPDSEIGTPYIWIPNSESNTLAQIRTENSDLGERGSVVQVFSGAACGFSNPSRVTVMPGGDVWVANRNNSSVTRLGLVDPDVSMESYECKGNYAVGGGPRGVTYDIDGKIWVGGIGDANMYRFNPDGTISVGPINIGGTMSYGMIGDAYGYIWVSDRLSIPDRIVKINCSTNIVSSSTVLSENAAYGIGIDNEGDIWVGNSLGTEAAVHQIAGTDGTNITPAGLPNVTICGVAVDQNNVVWAAACGLSPGKVYAFNQDGTQLIGSPFPTGNLTRGIAVDFDGNIWAVNRGGGAPDGNPVLNPSGCGGGGSVTVLASDGSYIATYSTCGNNPYNYSDMTGLRTVPKTLTIGSTGTTMPLSDEGTFEICSDPSAPPLCSDSSNCDALLLPTSCGSAGGFCEIPLEIFSMQMGDYTLTNLEVVYGKRVPITTGGLVPCGREWNDDETSWDDTEPCTPCYLIPLADNVIGFLLEIVSVLAILFIVIGGILYASSAGNSSSLNTAKLAIVKSITGFMIVFLAWLMVNAIMILFGFADPLGDGSWKIFNCTT